MTKRRFDPVPRAPFTKTIAFTDQSATFNRYGRSIDLDYLTDVMGQATAWLTRKMIEHGPHGIVPSRSREFPQGPRFTSSNTVRFYIRPQAQTTWQNLGALLLEMHDFITQYGPFEYHIELSSIRSGLLGSADFRYVARAMLNEGAVNDTLPSDGNLTAVSPDPMTYKVPGTRLRIEFEFTNIGKAISATDIGSCLFQALFTVIGVTLDKGGDTFMDRGKRDFPLI